MYYVSAQGVDERAINVHYYYHCLIVVVKNSVGCGNIFAVFSLFFSFFYNFCKICLFVNMVLLESHTLLSHSEFPTESSNCFLRRKPPAARWG